MLSIRFWALVGIVVTAAAMRLLPHPPNFTPIAAMAFFVGAHFARRRSAFAVPLAAMFVSDLALGLIRYGSAVFSLMPFVYAGFAIMVCLGLVIRHRIGPLSVGATALAGSMFFFFITNFGVWLRGSLYPSTLDGLVACYTAAIPFFRNTLAGDAFYTALLFGGFALAQSWLPALRERVEVVPVGP